MGDAMKPLENRTWDLKREMDILAALDKMKSMKSRHPTVSMDEILTALQHMVAHKLPLPLYQFGLHCCSPLLSFIVLLRRPHASTIDNHPFKIDRVQAERNDNQANLRVLQFAGLDGVC